MQAGHHAAAAVGRGVCRGSAAPSRGGRGICVAAVALAAVVSAGGATAVLGLVAHLGEVDAELAGELVQDAARDEGHDDHEEDLVRVALGVAPDFAQKVLQLLVQVLHVVVAGRALVPRCRAVVARRRRVRRRGVARTV